MKMRNALLIGIIASFGLAMAAVPIFTANIQQDKAAHLKQYSENVIEHGLNSVIAIRVSKGAGSGVLISDDGYMLTANHIVDGEESKNVKIKLRNNPIDYSADIIAVSKDYDLALLKIKHFPKKDMHYLNIAEWNDVKVGTTIYIIGHPLVYPWTVTKGIVSCLNRPLSPVFELFQFDGAINFGSSGGAIINEDGDLIGIVSMMSLPQGPAFNFGIPADRCRKFVNAAMKSIKADKDRTF